MRISVAIATLGTAVALFGCDDDTECPDGYTCIAQGGATGGLGGEGGAGAGGDGGGGIGDAECITC